MPPKQPQKYLYDVLGSCDFLLGFTANRAIKDYENDRAFRSAVERELQIIGEAIMQLARIVHTFCRPAGDFVFLATPPRQ